MTTPRQRRAQEQIQDRQRRRREDMARQRKQERQRREPRPHMRGRVTRPTEEQVTQERQLQQARAAQERHEQARSLAQPFTDDEGRVDLVAALQSGLTEDQLRPLFEAEVLEQGRTTVTARGEIGDRELAAYLREGGSPEVAISAGYEPDLVQAVFEAREHLDDQGQLDIAAALEGGIDPSVLERLGIEDQRIVELQEGLAAQAQFQADLEEVRPYLVEEDRLDVAAALEGGVSRETLERLGVTEEQIAAATQPAVAAPAPASVMPAPPDTLEAQHINQLNRQWDLIDTLIFRGIAPGTELTEQQRGNLGKRVGLFLEEVGLNLAGMRTAYEVNDRQVQRQIGATENRINILQRASVSGGHDWNGNPITAQQARDNLPFYQNQLAQQQARLSADRQAMADFDRYTRQLVPQLRQEIDRRMQGLVGGVEVQQVAPSFAGLPAGPDIPAASEALRRAGIQVAGTGQYALVDPETGQQVGVTQEPQAAVDQGFFVRPVAAVELAPPRLTEPESQARALELAQAGDVRGLVRLGITGESITDLLRFERVRRGLALELGLPESTSVEAINQEIERLRTERIQQDIDFSAEPRLDTEDPGTLMDQRSRVIRAVNELGPHAAVQQGRVTAAEVQSIFGRDVFRAAPVEELAMAPGETLTAQQQEAITELGRLGLAEERGIFVTDAARAGREDLLLQAGFTPEQIQEAQRREVQDLGAPTAEPRFIPTGNVFDPRTGQFGPPIIDPDTGEFRGVRADGVDFIPGVSDRPWGPLLVIQQGVERALAPLRLLQESTGEALLRGGDDPELQRIMAAVREGRLSETEARQELQDLFHQRPLAQQIPVVIATDPLIIASAPGLAQAGASGVARMATTISGRGIARTAVEPTLVYSTQRAPIAARTFAEGVQRGQVPNLTVEASYAGDRAFLSEVQTLKDLMVRSRVREAIVPRTDLPPVDLPPGVGEALLAMGPQGMRRVSAVQVNMRPYPEFIRGGLEAERIIATQTARAPGVFTDLNVVIREPLGAARMNAVIAELRGVPNITVRTVGTQETSAALARDADFLARRLRDIGVRVTRADEVAVPFEEGAGMVANPALNVELRPHLQFRGVERIALNPGEVAFSPSTAPTGATRVAATALPGPIDFTGAARVTLPGLPPGDVGLLAQRLAPTLRQSLTMRLGAGRAAEIIERAGVDGDRPATWVFAELPEVQRVTAASEIVAAADDVPPGLTPEERADLLHLMARSIERPSIPPLAEQLRLAEERRLTAVGEISPELQVLVERGIAPEPTAPARVEAMDRPAIAAELQALVERSAVTAAAPSPVAPASPVGTAPQVRTAPAMAEARPLPQVMDRPVGAAPELQELVARGVAPAAPAEALRLNPRQIGVRLATLTRMANLPRPMTELELARVRNYIADLGAAALTPAQQARLDHERQRLVAAVPQLSTDPALAPAPALSPEPFPSPSPAPLPAPEPFPTPTPTTITVPTLRTPPRRPPRTPTRTPVPGRPPRPPSRPRPGFGPDTREPDDAAGPNVRVVGFQRGAVGDTSVDLVTGDTSTVKDIDAVPPRPTKQSFTVLTFNGETPQPQRIPWGALDKVVYPDGTQKWIKAGAPIPPRPSRSQGRPPRGRGFGRRMGGPRL